MPHAAISILKGRSRKTQEALAKKIEQVIAEELSVKEDLVSVSLEEVEDSSWKKHMEQFEPTMIIAQKFQQKKKEQAKAGPVAQRIESVNPKEAIKERLAKKKINLTTLHIASDKLQF